MKIIKKWVLMLEHLASKLYTLNKDYVLELFCNAILLRFYIIHGWLIFYRHAPFQRPKFFKERVRFWGKKCALRAGAFALGRLLKVNKK